GGSHSDDEYNPTAILPIVSTITAIRHIADLAVKEKQPRSHAARRVFESEMHALVESVRQLRGRAEALEALAAAGNAEAAEALGEDRELLASLDLALDLLAHFWSAPSEWLYRLRKCEVSRSGAPYFLDRAADAHARFCSVKHRVYAHRDRRHPTPR